MHRSFFSSCFCVIVLGSRLCNCYLTWLHCIREHSPLFVTWNKRSFAYTEEDAPNSEAAITQASSSDQVVEADEEDDEEEDQEDHDEEDEEDVSLRGCIGTFTALPLEKGLREYAITR
jgi:AMMECR1 domain-containing protein